MKIEIENTEVRTRTITAEKGDFTVKEQDAFCYQPSRKYPVPFTLQLGKEASAYAPGMYELSEDSFFISRFGQLTLRRELNLNPLVG